MSSPSPDRMDSLIERALRSEPPRDMPPGFLARVTRRVRTEALLEEERRRFRRYLLRWSAGCGVFALCAAALVVGLGLPAGALQEVPGALGYWDYLTVSFSLWLMSAAGSGVMLLLYGVGGTVAITLPLMGALRRS